MLNTWLDRLEWKRVRPVLFAVGCSLMAWVKIGDIRSNDGWTVVLDWLSLVFLAVFAVHSARESWRLERAARAARAARAGRSAPGTH